PLARPFSRRREAFARRGSILHFLAEIAAQQVLLQNDSVAVVDRDLARLVGIGQPPGFRQRLVAVGEPASRLALAFLCYGPAPFGWMNSVNVASQHCPSRSGGLGSPTRSRRAAFRYCYAGSVLKKETGTGVNRSRVKDAGGKPATGRLCRTGPGVLGRGSGPAHTPHRCGMVENALRANAFHRSVGFLLRGGGDPLICDQLTSVSAVRAGSSVPRGACGAAW